MLRARTRPCLSAGRLLDGAADARALSFASLYSFTYHTHHDPGRSGGQSVLRPWGSTPVARTVLLSEARGSPVRWGRCCRPSGRERQLASDGAPGQHLQRVVRWRLTAELLGACCGLGAAASSPEWAEVCGVETQHAARQQPSQGKRSAAAAELLRPSLGG